jgi:hypothetical protein
MNRDDVRDLVAAPIREHELRVALWSGLMGAVLMAGTWHAIWLCR